MRFLHTTLFSLAASAVVLPVDISNTREAQLTKRDNVTNKIMTEAMLKLVEYAFKDSLPSAIQTVLTQMHWMLSWSEKPIKTAVLEPQIKMADVSQETKRAKFSYGPYEIRGSSEPAQNLSLQMDSKSTLYWRTFRGMPNNAAILASKVSLSFLNGTTAGYNSGLYVHHVLIADVNKPSIPFAMCPNRGREDNVKDWFYGNMIDSIGAGLFSGGQDALGTPNVFFSRSEKAPFKSAFLTGNNDLFGMQAELVNYNPKNETVFLDIEVEYMEQVPSDWLDASTMILSATGCKDPGYRPPSQEKIYTHVSEKVVLPNSGYIVNTRGHLHDGGTGIELWHNDKLVCESKPTYGRAPGTKPHAEPTIIDMSWCMDPIPLKKDDTLQLKTHYDLTRYQARQQSGSEKDANGTAAAPAHSHRLLRRDGGHGDHAGMEEMGIMTTNFAWDKSVAPPVKRAAWVSHLFGLPA